MWAEDTYNVATGPVATPGAGQAKRSPRDYRAPMDLARSRRVGLRLDACPTCGAKRREGVTLHASTCDGPLPTEFMTLTTGPLRPTETSKDTGWVLAR